MNEIEQAYSAIERALWGLTDLNSDDVHAVELRDALELLEAAVPQPEQGGE